jgi:hypothetical protein
MIASGLHSIFLGSHITGNHAQMLASFHQIGRHVMAATRDV